MLFKIAMVWLATVLLGTIWLTQSGAGKQVSMTVLPETPRQGEPILVTFKLANPYPFILTTGYDFYANGALLKQGQTSLGPFSAKTYQYAYASPVKIGERVNFVVKASTPQGNFEKSISAPPFPPQVCSSFISFASFSTTVMSSMSSMAYYSDNFAQASKGLNTGLVISLTLAKEKLIQRSRQKPTLVCKRVLTLFW